MASQKAIQKALHQQIYENHASPPVIATAPQMKKDDFKNQLFYIVSNIWALHLENGDNDGATCDFKPDSTIAYYDKNEPAPSDGKWVLNEDFSGMTLHNKHGIWPMKFENTNGNLSKIGITRD